MYDTVKDMKCFRDVASQASNFAMEVSDLALMYSELAMFHTYIKARYPEACKEAQLFVEERQQETGINREANHG